MMTHMRRLVLMLVTAAIVVAGVAPVSHASTAGATWEAQEAPAGNWEAVTFGGGLFMAIDRFGDRIMSSTDGSNWTASGDLPLTSNWADIAYGNGRFVAVSASNTNSSVVSTDGVTWSSGSPTLLRAYAVTFGNGYFVAVSDLGSMRSADGITWEAVVSSPRPVDSWSSVAFGGSRFVAVGYDDNGVPYAMYSSDDATTWTSTGPLPGSYNYLESVAFGDGSFVAVSSAPDSVSNGVLTSPDGATWTARTSAADLDWTSVAYGDGSFVAVGKPSPSSSSLQRVMTSTDSGVTWEIHNAVAANDWRSVAFGNGLFVAVSSLASSDRVMTSGSMGPIPVSADPSTWLVIYQAVPLPQSGNCEDVDPGLQEHVAYGTGLLGGWSRSWELWVSGGAGGWACHRTLLNTGGSRWQLGQ